MEPYLFFPYLPSWCRQGHIYFHCIGPWHILHWHIILNDQILYVTSLQYKKRFCRNDSAVLLPSLAPTGITYLSQTVQTYYTRRYVQGLISRKEENSTSTKNGMGYKNITGFIICNYDCKWRVSLCVYTLCTEGRVAYPLGSSQIYTWRTSCTFVNDIF